MKVLIVVIILITGLAMAYKHGESVEAGKAGLTLEQIYSTIR